MSAVNNRVLPWCVFGESVQGASHKQQNLPNQDAIAWHCPEPEGSPLILAVADGHGSEKYFRSDQGARFAVDLAVEELTLFAQAFSGPVTNMPLFTFLVEQLPQKIVEKWQTRVREDLAASPFFTPEEWRRYDNGTSIPPTTRNPLLPYGATLLAVLVTKGFLLYLQLGDGDIVQVTEEAVASKPVKGDERLLANETTSLCSSTAIQDFRMHYEHFVDAPPALICLSTDGYANCFHDEASFLRVGSDILEQIRERGVEQIRHDLSGWLATATEQGSGDDITLGILYHASTASAPSSDAPTIEQTSKDDGEEAQPEPALPATVAAEVLPAQPVLIVSSQPGDGRFTSIQAAVAAAPVHARIEVQPGVYRERLLIEKDVELVGMNEQGAVIIEATAPCVTIRAGGAQLHNFTIRGKPSLLNRLRRRGRALVEITAGCPTLYRCEISGGRVGLRISGATTAPVLQGCRIHDHTHTGIVFSDNALGLLMESHIETNRRRNIVLSNGSNPHLCGCTIRGAGGSGIHIGKGASGKIEGCDIVDNRGAGIFVERGGNPTVQGCPQIAHNLGGGLLFARQAGGSVMECNIATNGLYNIGITGLSDPHIQHCRLQDADGPALLIDGQGKGGGGLIEECDISGHQAETIIIRRASRPFIRSCAIHEGVLLQQKSRARIEKCTIVTDGRPCMQVSGKGSALSMSETKLHQQVEAAMPALAVRDGGAGQLQQCKVTTPSSTAIFISHNATLTLRRCRIESGSHAIQAQRGSAARVDGGTYRSQLHGKTTEAMSWDESSAILEIQDTEIQDTRLIP